jgi:hypothetical protein
MAAAIGAGCGQGDSVVGGSCSSGYVQCGDQCIDLGTDPDHCGACNTSCLPGVACVAGSCGQAEAGADASSDATSDTLADGSPSDATAADGADAPGADASDAGTDVVSNDGPVPDGPSADATLSDAAMPDATMPDATAIDASDATTLEASVDSGTSADATDANAIEDASDASVDESDSDSPAESDDGASESSTDDGGDAFEEPLDCAPLTACNGVCLDTTFDPSNCGSCGNVCFSGICRNSHCIGENFGAVIYIGHDYTQYSQAQARLLLNAVLLPQSLLPLPVISYERYASATAVTNVKAILATAPVTVGRAVTVTSTTNDDDVPIGLNAGMYRVLIVSDQLSATTGTLASLGANWFAALSTFTQSGGVVVVLDGDTGVAEMPQFMTSTTLLYVTSHSPVSLNTSLDVVARTDALSTGIGDTYSADTSTASFATEPESTNVVYVVSTPGDDATPGAPVVIHKAF